MLRGFFSSRAGVAALVVGALTAAGVTAVVLRGDENEPLPQAATELTTTTTVPPPAAAPAGKVLVGASTSPDVRTLAAEKTAVEELERLIGRTLDIDHNFYTWDEAFPTESERWNLAAGRIPMISWNGRGPTTDQIAAGRFDDMIKQRAQATKALGKPVFIRWFWEMDGNKKAEYAGTPAEYIAAWQQIVRTFRAEGADNVSWVWCPNASAFNDGEAQEFYPGDEFVDWTCADGYNWAPGRRGDDYRSFKDIFGGFYGWAALHDKPIMVGEFGVQERNPGEKAKWITDVRESIKTDFPLMRAIVYFSSNKDYDWRLTTSDSAVQAFRQLVQDPYFNVGPDRRLPL
jgi:beta-mannanase